MTIAAKALKSILERYFKLTSASRQINGYKIKIREEHVKRGRISEDI